MPYSNNDSCSFFFGLLELGRCFSFFLSNIWVFNSLGLYARPNFNYQDIMKISTVSVKASALMLIAFCLFGSLTAGCSADWSYLYSVEEMTQRADVILVGNVESIINCPNLNNVPYWSRQVQVSVELYLKHFMESTNVTIIADGATFRNNTYGASGNAPEFEESERVLLFLEEGVNGFYKVLMGSQGKFTIVNDTAVSEPGLVIENVRGFTETDIKYRRMVEEADFIVVGNVTRMHGTNYVYVTIAVEEYVTKPQNLTEITLSVRDAVVGFGRVGGNVSAISNSDLFEVGERVFVFVERRGPRLWVLDGLAGKYTVIEEWPPYIRSHYGILDGWSTAPGWKPRMVHRYSPRIVRETGTTVEAAFTTSQPWGPLIVAVTMFLLLASMKCRKMFP